MVIAKDKNGNELKEDDFVYYSELPFSNYADSLNIIKKRPSDNKHILHCLVYNSFGTYKLYSDIDIDQCPSIEDYYHAEDVLKVKPDCEYVEFMNKNFPLKKEQR